MITDNELDPGALARRADHAKRLLEDEMLQEAFANLRIAYFEEWLNTKREEDGAREALYMASQAIQHVENHLRIVLDRTPVQGARSAIEGQLDSLKKIKLLRRDTLRREGPVRSGNAAGLAGL